VAVDEQREGTHWRPFRAIDRVLTNSGRITWRSTKQECTLHSNVCKLETSQLVGIGSRDSWQYKEIGIFIQKVQRGSAKTRRRENTITGKRGNAAVRDMSTAPTMESRWRNVILLLKRQSRLRRTRKKTWEKHGVFRNCNLLIYLWIFSDTEFVNTNITEEQIIKFIIINSLSYNCEGDC